MIENNADFNKDDDFAVVVQPFFEGVDLPTIPPVCGISLVVVTVIIDCCHCILLTAGE